MRLVASIADGPTAERFGDFLSSIQIMNTVEAGASGATVWVHDDDQVPAAQRELLEFQRDSNQPRYAQASVTAHRLRRDVERKEQLLRQNYVDVRTSTGWTGLARKPMPLTIALIAISCIVTFITRFGSHDQWLTNKMYIASVEEVGNWIYWNDLHDIRHGQVWRLITPIFLHLSPMHLIFNMWWMIDLGSMIERRKGTRWMLLLVLLPGIAGNLAQYAWAGPTFGGMSGVVYALFGYAWMKGIVEPREGIAVRQQTVIVMLVWLVLCMTGLVGAVANADHLIGLLAGVSLGLTSILWRKFSGSRQLP